MVLLLLCLQCNASCGQEGRQKLVFYCMRGSNEVDIEDCNNVTKPRDRFRPCMNPCRQAPSFNDNGVTRVISVNLNEPVRITCHAEGYPPPEVEWSWVNPTKHQVFESLRMTDGLTILKRGQLLVINHMVEGLEGRFTCTAKNSYNQVAHSSGMLAINQAPTFLDDPAGEPVKIYYASCSHLFVDSAGKHCRQYVNYRYVYQR